MRRLLLLTLTACAAHEDDPPIDSDEGVGEAFPRCADHAPDRRPYFGDLHVHTALSLDASTQGTRLRPADAWRFARGETVTIQPHDAAGNGLRSLRLERPLDFAAVTDHSEFLGTVALCTTPGSATYDAAECRAYRDDPDAAYLTFNARTAARPSVASWPFLCGDDGVTCRDAGLEVWAEVRESAEAAYDRTDACTFTAFTGYEWSGGPSTRNLHRNVIFRNEHVPDLPVSYFDEPFVPGLWDRLRATCLDAPPCDVLTIPHNANLSHGLMFEPAESFDAQSAADRAAMEPLVEIYQHKGDGECWPGSPAADELCDFEKVPYNTLSGARLQIEGDPVPLDFVRDVLGEGLKVQAATGVNPYRYGVVASTDTHIGAPGAVDEVGFPGHGGAGQGHREALPVGVVDFPAFSPGGLAVLWAEENSREGLWRAMERREAYGTSGPRIVLRFFAGDYDEGVCDAGDLPRLGYAGGVPMGGDLPLLDGPPVFVVAAEADPGTDARPGAGLQRLQIVKGWLDGDTFRTEVFDVAGDPEDGALDEATCEASGGADALCAAWTDEAFDPEVPAYWYARVVEVPTCRWTAHACLAAEVTCPTEDPGWSACCDDEIPVSIQERAWSSPVWHVPT